MLLIFLVNDEKQDNNSVVICPLFTLIKPKAQHHTKTDFHIAYWLSVPLLLAALLLVTRMG